MSSDRSASGATGAWARMRVLLSAGLLAACALSSCGFGDTNDPMDERGLHVESIQDRPTLDVITVEYRELAGQIKDVISEIVPGGQWGQYSADKKPSCRENKGDDDPRALRLISASWGLDARPTSEQWDLIRERVTPLLREHGFTTVAMDTKVHEGAVFKVAGPYDGSEYSISFGKALSTGFITGCHLP